MCSSKSPRARFEKEREREVEREREREREWMKERERQREREREGILKEIDYANSVTNRLVPKPPPPPPGKSPVELAIEAQAKGWKKQMKELKEREEKMLGGVGKVVGLIEQGERERKTGELVESARRDERRWLEDRYGGGGNESWGRNGNGNGGGGPWNNGPWNGPNDGGINWYGNVNSGAVQWNGYGNAPPNSNPGTVVSAQAAPVLGSSWDDRLSRMERDVADVRIQEMIDDRLDRVMDRWSRQVQRGYLNS